MCDTLQITRNIWIMEHKQLYISLLYFSLIV